MTGIMILGYVLNLSQQGDEYFKKGQWDSPKGDGELFRSDAGSPPTLGADFIDRDLHTKKTSQEGSHFQMRKGPRDDFYSLMADGFKNGLRLLLGIDEGIGGP